MVTTIEIKGKGFIGYDSDLEGFRVLGYEEDANNYSFYFLSVHRALEALGQFYEFGEFSCLLYTSPSPRD